MSEAEKSNEDFISLSEFDNYYSGLANDFVSKKNIKFKNIFIKMRKYNSILKKESNIFENSILVEFYKFQEQTEELDEEFIYIGKVRYIVFEYNYIIKDLFYDADDISTDHAYLVNSLSKKYYNVEKNDIYIIDLNIKNGIQKNGYGSMIIMWLNSLNKKNTKFYLNVPDNNKKVINFYLKAFEKIKYKKEYSNKLTHVFNISEK